MEARGIFLNKSVSPGLRPHVSEKLAMKVLNERQQFEQRMLRKIESKKNTKLSISRIDDLRNTLESTQPASNVFDLTHADLDETSNGLELNASTRQYGTVNNTSRVHLAPIVSTSKLMKHVESVQKISTNRLQHIDSKSQLSMPVVGQKHRFLNKKDTNLDLDTFSVLEQSKGRNDLKFDSKKMEGLDK